MAHRSAPLSTAALSCESVTLRWPAATSWSPPVLEYGVWYGPAKDKGKGLQRYRTDGLGGTTLEVSGLEAGVAYTFEVRARTSEKWNQYTAARTETTLVPADFPYNHARNEPGLQHRAPQARCCAIATRRQRWRCNTRAGTRSPPPAPPVTRATRWTIMRNNVLGGE